MKKILFFLSCLLLFSCQKNPVLYILTTSANPVEGGTVLPATRQYEAGDTANLVAAPAAEYVFQSWTGATGGAETTLVMAEDKTVVANFIKKTYPLTIKVEGEGSVAQKVIKAGVSTDYNSGTIVELTANCTNKWKFKEWKGDLTGTESPKQITIDKPKTVTAVFEELPPFYLDANGVTIKARDWVLAGTKGEVNGVTYEAVDIVTLRSIFKIPSNWGQYQPSIKAAEERLSKVVTTLITDMSDLFSNAPTSNSEGEFYVYYNQFNPDISSWDVSNVTNMSNMFRRDNITLPAEDDICSGGLAYHEGRFNKDISKWDVSNVTNMSGMFFKAVRFNQDISKWDVSNVTDMSNMFVGANAFHYDLGSWDVSKVTNTSGMFAKLYHKIGDIQKDFNISGWDVSNVTNMSCMFLENGMTEDFKNWNVSNVTNMSRMFGAFTGNYFNVSGIEGWNVSKATNMSGMFRWNWLFNLDISNWDVSNVTDMSNMFMSAHSFNQDINSWNVSNVTNMSGMFSGYLISIYKKVMDFNKDIGSWDVSKVTDMSKMFYFNEPFNQDLGNWNVSNVTDMSYMFSSAKSFDQPIGDWKVSKVTDMSHMFSYASVFNQRLVKWCVNNITSEPTYFSTASALTTDNKPKWGTCPSN